MSEDVPRYAINESAAVVQTVEVIAGMGNRTIAMDLRESLLSAVDVIERCFNISPRTSELRRMWRASQCEKRHN